MSKREIVIFITMEDPTLHPKQKSLVVDKAPKITAKTTPIFFKSFDFQKVKTGRSTCGIEKLLVEWKWSRIPNRKRVPGRGGRKFENLWVESEKYKFKE